jgi:hypothetical protein
MLRYVGLQPRFSLEMQMSDACARLADHVLEGLLDAVTFAEKRGLPPEQTVLAAALETAVNLLAFERCIDITFELVEQLAAQLGKRELFDFGWALAQLRQQSRKQGSPQPCRD